MDLSWLDDFLALAETLNFSRAAEMRHVTQPAFSRRIQALEAWIGTKLLARTTHGVTLTAAGGHLRGRAETLSRDVRQLRTETLGWPAARRRRCRLPPPTRCPSPSSRDG